MARRSSESLRGIEGLADRGLHAARDHGLLHAPVSLDGELPDEDGPAALAWLGLGVDNRHERRQRRQHGHTRPTYTPSRRHRTVQDSC